MPSVSGLAVAFPEGVDDIIGAQWMTAGEVAQGEDADLTGDLTRRMSTHPVGDREDAAFGDITVLIELPHAPDVGGSTHPDHRLLAHQVKGAGRGHGWLTTTWRDSASCWIAS